MSNATLHVDSKFKMIINIESYMDRNSKYGMLVGRYRKISKGIRMFETDIDPLTYFLSMYKVYCNAAQKDLVVNK